MADPLAGLSASLLNGYVGLNIGKICPVGYDDAALNHCAHFVSHVLQLNLGVLCSSMKKAKSAAAAKKGASIRVQEVFEGSAEVGAFDAKTTGTCLIYVCKATIVDLDAQTMTNVPKKHIGIHLDGTVWHYSNSKHRVVTQTPDEFIKHYSTQTNALFYSKIPAGAVPNQSPSAEKTSASIGVNFEEHYA